MLVQTTETPKFIALSPGFIVSATTILLLVFRSLFHAYSPKKHKIPGPFFAQFSRLWYLKRIWNRQFHIENIELHRQYGPIVRIAPNEFSVSDPGAIKTIYGHSTHFTKSLWYSTFALPGAPNLFSDHDSQRHGQDRRKLASLYSMSTLVNYEPAVHECAALIKERFREFAKKGVVINLHHWLQCYAFDLIASITLAKRFGFLDTGNDSLGIFRTLHEVQVYGSHFGVYHELHPLFFAIQQFLAKFGRGGNGQDTLLNFASKQIKARQEAVKGVQQKAVPSDDFLAKVLEKHEANPGFFTMADVLQACGMNIGAGSDTTGISLTAIMWFLIKNPATLYKLRDEIDAKVASGEASSPVTFKEAQKMPYLQAVVKEALRMHPATGLPMARTTPKGGAMIAGYYVPEGCSVGVNSWVAHYSSDVYGPDAAMFRPERWLESSPEQLQRMEHLWMPFGHGSRTCIGKNISLLEISVLVPELVCNFEFQLEKAGQELVCDNVWFVKQKNVFCRITDRTT